MSIKDQFSGLPMDQLIGGPLKAAAEAEEELARSTAEFICGVGLSQPTRTVTITATNQNQEEVSIDVPLLSIVPIPNLKDAEANVLFNMEVKLPADKQPPEE